MRTIESHRAFTDNKFPPNVNSLLDTEEKNGGLDSKTVSCFEKLVWRRTTSIWPGYQRLFPKDGLKSGMINQGRLADCYFLSLVDALIKVLPIEDLFLIKEVNKAGIYAIKLFVDGQWQEVIVDDYLPCSKDTGLPIFACSREPEECIWICLLEKAWAKLHGTYCMTR